MYSYEVKSEVEKRIKSGVRLKKINEDTTISLSTLKKWKKEIVIRKRAKNLIFEGKIEEARIEIGKLSPESNKSVILSLESLIARREGNKEKEKELLELVLKYEPKNAIVISSLINMAREKNDIEKEKELLERQLELEPKDTIIMSSLIRITREEENKAREEENEEKEKELLEREKELLERQLELEPNDTIAMSGLIVLAREENDTEKEKRLLTRQLELEPENVKTISSLVKIARKEGKIEKAKELLEKRLKIEPDNIIAIESLIKIAENQGDIKRKKELKEMLDSIKENQTEKYFSTMITRKNKQINVVNQARDLIIRSNTKDMLYVISTIKKSIEGEDATLQALVQAEAALKAKLYKQAEGYLRAHKKILKDDEIALKAINKALSIIQLKNKLYDTLKWKSIYDEYEKAREKEICESKGKRKDKNNEYIQEETINNKEIQLDEEGR